MKKILSLLMMALMAISANAQEVCVFNPDNSLSLDPENGTALAAGTVIGETESIVATIGADNIYKPKSVKATVTGGEINGGLQGNSNPYDADGGLPGITLHAPVCGAYLEFEAKADGFLYLIINTLSNKTYTVFEEGTAIGYTFAATGDSSTDLGEVYKFTLVGEGELNEIKYPIERAEQEFLKATDPEKYAAHQTTNADSSVSWTAIKVNGLGVIKFPVYKDCKYIVAGSGTKIIAAGYVFSKEENVTITSDDLTIIGDGVELCYNYIAKGKIAEVISNPNGKYKGSVIIPATVTHEGEEYEVTKIADNAFGDCTNLISITIPSSVNSIGESAFAFCTSLPSINIPNSVTNIGRYAFYNCTALTSVTIPNSVTSIVREAFWDCTALTSITIPNSVTYIGYRAFAGCSGLTFVTIPNSVTSIDAFAFSGCTGLTSITIPNSVTYIGSRAFEGCSGLTFVTIPNSVNSINGEAFSECIGLTSVTIGSGVNYVGGKAFGKCYNLTNVYCLAEELRSDEWNGEGLYTDLGAFYESYPQFMTLHVPAASIDAYRSMEPWSTFKAIVPLEAGETPEIQKCSTPEISYENGMVKFTCETEGVEFISSVRLADEHSYYDDKIQLSQKYKISVYATKTGYYNSDTTTREIEIKGDNKPIVVGDVDGDGKVNVADHVKLSDIIMNQ